MPNPVPFALRPYRAEDAEACAGVFDRAWHAGHPYAQRPIGLENFLREVASRRIIVAEHDTGEVVGFAAVYLPDRFIHHLYVEPSWSRRGIGAALLAEALALAGGRATLKCQLRNAEAFRFYYRAGWTMGERGDSGGEPWVRMLSPHPNADGFGSQPCPPRLDGT